MITNVSEEKKLTFVCRVEGGCLGPEGEKLVARFCGYAMDEMESWHTDYLNLKILPRIDKTMPEFDYQISGRGLSRDQAGKYLTLFQQNPDALEDELNSHLVELINRYLDR
jgi:hypothetical protein